MSFKLTIDGSEVQVEPGTTILDAARKLGIEIPTLCHLEGVKPTGSCFLCVVQVDGDSNLIPSCTAPARDGMEVLANSEDIRAARKMALELLLSDHVGDCVAPCTLGCPAKMDIAALNRHIAAGNYRRALAVVRERIALPASLGRICPRYCERVCRRRELDEPIAICALKRFAADADLASGNVYLPPHREATGKGVAIVGAGPAGLSAAYYLLREGHSCTLFDAHSKPGGMFRYGVPEFRLPQAVLEGEIDVIRRLGAEFRMRTRLGRDVSLEGLRYQYDAVFLAIGAQLEDKLDFEGEESALSAVEFLHRVAEGDGPEVGDAVLVIGGGNEAVAAARTARRLGARSVTIVCERTRRAMSCFRELVDEAEAEGVKLELEAEVVQLEENSGDCFTLLCKRAEETILLDASCVIRAPARRVDAGLAESLGVTVSKRGIVVDRNTLATNLEGVFAGGEAVSGPGSGVRAVAAGRLAAVSIHQALSGRELTGDSELIKVRLGKLNQFEQAALFRDIEERPRARLRTIEVDRRQASFEEIEGGFSESEAREEAARCLQCDCLARDDCKLRILASAYGARVSRFRGDRRPFERDTSHPEIVYESGKCILCGLCVRITTGELEKLGMSFTQRGFATRVRAALGALLAQGLTTTARRCAEACPTGALALKRQEESNR